MGEVVGAMAVMVVQALVEVMNLALVLVLVGQEDPILVGEVMGAVVVTILTQDSFMTKLCSRNCMQV
jgi:type III secretory pathway component EscS